jgi:hypothetical protein
LLPLGDPAHGEHHIQLLLLVTERGDLKGRSRPLHSQPWLSRAMCNDPITMNSIATIVRPQQSTNAIHRW